METGELLNGDGFGAWVGGGVGGGAGYGAREIGFGSLASLEEAVRTEPSNLGALVRLAELLGERESRDAMARCRFYARQVLRRIENGGGEIDAGVRRESLERIVEVLGKLGGEGRR